MYSSMVFTFAENCTLYIKNIIYHVPWGLQQSKTSYTIVKLLWVRHEKEQMPYDTSSNAIVWRERSKMRWLDKIKAEVKECAG